MSYRIAFYCPDRHIVYDGETPYRVGVGGGITARVRMAKALARLGHGVQMIVNCPRERWIDGVHYLPLDAVERIRSDVVILNTSGGDLDLTPALDLEIETRLRIVWSHGIPKPAGLDDIQPDFVYAVSNFIAGVVRDEWGIPEGKIFVSYNGYDEDLFSAAEAQGIVRDPYRLIYFSHPSKGLDTAIAIIKKLRSLDDRYHLVVFGGCDLWGQQASPLPEEEGVRFGGLIGQWELAEELLRSTYSIQLQHREEPGALAIADAMRAGCIIISNPVGCYPEFVRDLETGIMVYEDHRKPIARMDAVKQIRFVAQNSSRKVEIMESARSSVHSTSQCGDSWVKHWHQTNYD